MQPEIPVAPGEEHWLLDTSLDEVYWPCSHSRAMPSFPSQLEWKIGLAWANKRQPEFPVVTRESRRNSRKTTWLPRHRKMKPFPATEPQEKSHVRNWRSSGSALWSQAARAAGKGRAHSVRTGLSPASWVSSLLPMASRQGGLLAFGVLSGGPGGGSPWCVRSVLHPSSVATVYIGWQTLDRI